MITFTVKRIDGTTEPFTGHPFDTLVDVMGVEALTDTQVFIRGTIANKYMSLSHENITDGCVLFAAKPRLVRKPVTNRPLNPWRDRELAREAREVQEEQERARTSDVIWSGWEMSRHHNRMLGVMRDRALGQAVSRGASREVTKLETATEIKETPLPCRFAKDGAHQRQRDQSDPNGILRKTGGGREGF
jgi:hypothetical protein